MFGKTESALAVSLKSVIHGLVIVCIAWQWYMVGHPFQNYDIVYVGFFAAYNRL